DQADGQLVKPVGVVEMRERSGWQEGGDDRVGEDRHLQLARGQDRGPKAAEHEARIWRQTQPGTRQRQARAPCGPDQQITCATPDAMAPQAAAWAALGKCATISSAPIVCRWG